MDFSVRLSTFWLLWFGPPFYQCLNLLSFTRHALLSSLCVPYPVVPLSAGLRALTGYFREPGRLGCPRTLIPSCGLLLRAAEWPLGSPLPILIVDFGSTSWACHLYCRLLLWGWVRAGKFWVPWHLGPSQVPLVCLLLQTAVPMWSCCYGRF